MTALLSALGSGLSAHKILEYLMRKSPQLAPRITKALASGLSAEKVVKFFSKDQNFEKLKESMEKDYPMENNANPLVQAQNVRKQNLGTDPTSSFQRNAGPALGAAAGIGTSMALSRAIPAILQRGVGALGAASPQTTQTMPQIGMQGTLPTSQSPMGPGPNSPGVQVMPNAPVNQQAPNIPQPPIPTQAINPVRDIKKSVDIIKSTGHEATVKNLIEGGLSPRDIKDTLGQIMGKKNLKELEKMSGGIEQAIEDYAQTMQSQPQEQPPMESPGMQLDEGQPQIEESKVSTSVPTQEIENVPEEIKPIQKHETVSTPQGIGEVKEIRNGKALVEVDGKIHKVDEDELIQSPISQDELADLHDNLIKGIEEHTGKEISKNVEWAGYDPKLNVLAYKPWMGGGKIYTYKDISPEDVTELQNILAERKTSGENYIGAWEKDTKSPIGNRMHALITRLQKERGGKGNEYLNKFETIYDPTEPAKKAAQQRYKDEQKLKKTGQQQPGASKTPPRSQPNEAKKEEKVKRKRSEILDEQLGKYYDKMMDLDEKLRLEYREKQHTFTEKEIQLRAENIKKLNALQKRVDDLRYEASQESAKEMKKK